MTDAQTTPRLLTSAEVCEQLGISKTKFYRLIAEDHLTPVKLPSPTGQRRELRFEQSEINAFIERNRAAS